jgi:hypothetical protein
MMKLFSRILLTVFLGLPAFAVPAEAQEDRMASIKEIAEKFPTNIWEFKLKGKRIIPCKEDEQLKPECSVNGGFLLEYRSDSGLEDASLYLFDVPTDLITDKQGAPKKEETDPHALLGETIHEIEAKSINGANHPLIERLWIIEKERFDKKQSIFSTGPQFRHEGIALNGSFRTAFFSAHSTGFVGFELHSYALALGAFHGKIAKVEFGGLPYLLGQGSDPYEIVFEFLDEVATFLFRQSQVVENENKRPKNQKHISIDRRR